MTPTVPQRFRSWRSGNSIGSLVTGQMIADLVILGLAIKIIVGAVKSRRQEQPDDSGVADAGPPGRGGP